MNSQESGDAVRGKLTSDELIEKLRAALRKNGDFPASAKVVSELRQLTSDPKVMASQVTEVILREPSLGVRVLHLVNSSFYRRAKPIMTVSQAVVQIGMRPLAELCSGLVLLQKFVPAAKRGGSFANCLRKTLLTSLLASNITPGTTGGVKSSKNEEYGYLAGSFAELGTLLLAFYFPQIYEAAVKRSELKKQDVHQSIREITGVSPLQLSLEVLDALNLPSFYKEILLESEKLETQPRKPTEGDSSESQRLAKAVSAAKSISDVVVSNKSRQDLDKVLQTAKDRFGIETHIINKVITDLPKIFSDHCNALDLQLPSLPEFVMTYTDNPEAATTESKSGTGDAGISEEENQFNQFVTEIRQAVENREPTASVITTVMETLAWSLKFDRVLLMLVAANKTRLTGRMLLGNMPNFDPKKFERSLSVEKPSCPEVVAFRQSRPVYSGEALFDGGWPFAAIPIGFAHRAIGVIYADRSSGDGAELSSREQAAIGILAELLDRSLALQA